MIDTTGGFDPRKLLDKIGMQTGGPGGSSDLPPGIGMQTGGPGGMYGPPPGVIMEPSPPQIPIDMWRSDSPPPVGMQVSPPQIPIDMYRSDYPPPVSMQQSPPQTPVNMNRSDTPTYTNPNIIPNVPPHQPIGGGVVPGITGDNTTLPKYTAGRETNWGSGTLDELKTYTGQSDWTDARTEQIRRASGNPDWGKSMNAPTQQSSISQAVYSGVPTGPIPNYTAPAAIPTTLPQQQQQQQQQPIVAPVIPPQDRWLGTQRRQPNYF